MNREIKNEIENIQWQIQLLRRFAVIGAMSQPDEDNFKKVAQDMENAVNRLNSILLKKNIQSITDNMTTFKQAHFGGLFGGLRVSLTRSGVLCVSLLSNQVTERVSTVTTPQ